MTFMFIIVHSARMVIRTLLRGGDLISLLIKTDNLKLLFSCKFLHIFLIIEVIFVSEEFENT